MLIQFVEMVRRATAFSNRKRVFDCHCDISLCRFDCKRNTFSLCKLGSDCRRKGTACPMSIFRINAGCFKMVEIFSIK